MQTKATWAGKIEIIAASSLIALVNHIKGARVLRAPTPHMIDETGTVADLKDVKGQERAKRALEIAAAGGHNMLMLKSICPTMGSDVAYGRSGQEADIRSTRRSSV